MKKILFITSVLTVSLFAELSVEQIEKMVSKIHLKREGVDLKTLDATKEPFAKTLEKKEEEALIVPTQKDKGKLSLHAIMNGKAYINDSWKRVNDKVMGYTLKYIGKRGVVLRNGNNVKKLFLYERENIIKLEERL